jgi:hypothetical protein
MTRLASFVYCSPFLSRLAGMPDWEAYRAGTLQVISGCRYGLAIDEDPSFVGG